MTEYKVKSNIKYKGKIYQKGETIEIEDTLATSLVEDGVLSKESTEEEKNTITPQPAVNKIVREKNTSDGEIEITPGEPDKIIETEEEKAEREKAEEEEVNKIEEPTPKIKKTPKSKESTEEADKL